MGELSTTHGRNAQALDGCVDASQKDAPKDGNLSGVEDEAALFRSAVLDKYHTAERAFAASAKGGSMGRHEAKKLAKKLGLKFSSSFKKTLKN